MNEPKRRGRPPKVQEPINPAQAYAMKEAAMADVEAKSKDPAKGNEKYAHIHSRSDVYDLAQSYAMRVWNGQSPDTLTRTERIRRCEAALTAQNLPTEGVEYP